MRVCRWLLVCGLVAQAAALDWTSAASFLAQHAGLVGIKVPTAVKYMTTYHKSSVLTRILHAICGRTFENAADHIMSLVKLPRQLSLTDLSNDQTQLYDGKVTGLEELALTKKGPHYDKDAEVEVAIEKFLPVFIIPVSFKNLTVFYRYRMGFKEGEATAKIQTHQLALKLRPTFNAYQGFCFFKMFDLGFTMWGNSDFNCKSTDGFSLTGGKASSVFVQMFFTDNQVERVVQNVIARELYYAIPSASTYLCENVNGSYPEKTAAAADADDTKKPSNPAATKTQGGAKKTEDGTKKSG